MSCTEIPAQCKSNALSAPLESRHELLNTVQKLSSTYPNWQPKQMDHQQRFRITSNVKRCHTRDVRSHFGKFLCCDVMNLPGHTENQENWCKEKSFKVHLVAICSILHFLHTYTHSRALSTRCWQQTNSWFQTYYYAVASPTWQQHKKGRNITL